MKRRSVLALLAALLLACAAAARADARFIILQSTTSTQNSGLFAAILPKFEAETGIEVRVVAVGTGQALRNARNGDGDVLIVHARDAEEAFVAAGHGLWRRDVMYNDFVIIGPSDDPAGIAGGSDARAALRAIAAAKAPFASRGDDSGTHRAELRLWHGSEVDLAAASGGWYLETGSGMGATLNIGGGLGAYMLSDRATWVAFGNKGAHRILVEGDPRLFNQYGVIVVTPTPRGEGRADDAIRFADWLTGPDGQAAIAAFKVDGQQLFVPNAQP